MTRSYWATTGLPADLGEDGRDQGVDELRADAQGSHQLVHTSGGYPDQVGVSDHRDQYGLGQLAALEQPAGEVRAGAQLGNSHINGPHPGAGVPVAVAVALGQALGASAAVLSAAHGIGIRRQQGVDHGRASDPGRPAPALGQGLQQGRQYEERSS